ncbi:MAG: hypothetical protein ABFE07_15465 [Armatimonadia bacterium]
MRVLRGPQPPELVLAHPAPHPERLQALKPVHLLVAREQRPEARPPPVARLAAVRSDLLSVARSNSPSAFPPHQRLVAAVQPLVRLARLVPRAVPENLPAAPGPADLLVAEMPAEGAEAAKPNSVPNRRV